MEIEPVYLDVEIPEEYRVLLGKETKGQSLCGSRLCGITVRVKPCCCFFLPMEFEYDERLAVLRDKSYVNTWV